MKNLSSFIFAIIFLSTMNVYAQENFCREEVNPISSSDLAYKKRGDRCEGLFLQQVSATGMRIAAYHKHPASYDETSLALNISSGTENSSKALTVTSLRPKQFYRMDTRFSGNNYSLPLDVVRHPDVNVTPSDFAAVVCKENCDASIPTLTPASFGRGDVFNPYIALVANLELFELRISIKADNTGKVLFDKEMLGKRTWPASRPATFPLKPYFKSHESITIEVIAVGRGRKQIDSISARLEYE
ncbi:hypothetical protein [Cohaesibacter gelatinilyticus]|uniref:Gliding motility-associated protein GldM C-terminal domain-containing protein n=1 Tax=Cohaesibacter gelatinilyticus TaxID=372072 RepID=A0A285NDC0_9HYPH|nr:hypothetical protein [Cohaesibacter gelatinilyticus]SNZ07455.1 hypothetical protein SAMN06265368_0978 [Cohaesibacter gelatinilyticus]